MKKTLKENSLLGIFQLDGTPAEQKQLKQLVEEVLNTKSGRQLVEDIGNIDFIPKPIKLFFVPKEQLSSEGQANAEEGTIRLTPVVPDHYFSKVSILAHELCHLRNGEVLTKILHKCSIPQQVYAHMTDEASAYAFEACIFEKELSENHPEFKTTCGYSQKEFIERWLQGKIKELAQGYIDDKFTKFHAWSPAMNESDFMHQIAPFQHRETALPLESFPWYKSNKSGGCYIVGTTKALLELDERGAPVFRCFYEGKGKFRSIIYSKKQRKTKEGVFVPAKNLCTIAKRPALPMECSKVQDYLDGKITKDDLPNLDDIALPKTVRNMTDVVTWRESFVPTQITKTTCKNTKRDPSKPYE
ncbi:MAG: hypothetical protein IKQ99_01755 [Alphaproteobacteria bacterium]|nr:hypothetical protein [Alphaproteobacteria bacterium]